MYRAIIASTNEIAAQRSDWCHSAMVAKIRSELYNNNYNGYAGNDDCGEMSAWYVMSAMGIYPVNPASGLYDLTVPLFDSVTIHLPSGDFTITTKRSRADATKMRRVALNGAPLQTLQLPHSSIVGGGTLTFELSR